MSKLMEEVLDAGKSEGERGFAQMGLEFFQLMRGASLEEAEMALRMVRGRGGREGDFSVSEGLAEGEMGGVRACVDTLVAGEGDGVLRDTAWGKDIVVPRGRSGKKGYGLEHIQEKRILHGFMPEEAAFIAVCAMKAAQSVKTPGATQNNKLLFDRFGVRAVVAEDKATGNPLITGFVLGTKGKNKAVDADAALNAHQFYALDELRRVQEVGAALGSALARFEGIIKDNPHDWEKVVEWEIEKLKVKQNAVADGTFMRAPNGAETKLKEGQWLAVRTGAFKDWFGDWEGDAASASKVVDENGEPMVVYHFTEYEGNVLRTTNDYGVGALHFYTSNRDEKPAEYQKYYGSRKIAAFLNLRNPQIIDAQGKDYDNISYNGRICDTYDIAADARKLGFDGVIINNVREFGGTDIGTDWLSFTPEQIKSATDNRGTFDSSNADITFGVHEGLAENVKLIHDKHASRNRVVPLCSAPRVLRALGESVDGVNARLFTLRKLQDKHGLSDEQILEVVERMDDPLMVFRDGVHSYLFLLDMTAKNNDGVFAPVEAAIGLKKDNGMWMLSAYPLDYMDKIEKEIRQKHLVYSKYRPEEINEAASFGNYAPDTFKSDLLRLLKGGFSENTITEGDVVKSGDGVRGVDFGVRDWYVADMKREMERSRSDAVREYWGHVVERVEAEGRTLDGMLNGRVGVDDVRVRVAEARSIMKVAIGTLPEGVRGKLAGQERLLDYLVGVMNSGRLGESGMLSEGEREELNRRLELDPGMLDGLVGSSVERLLGKVYRRCGEVIELYVRDMLLGEVKGLIREYEAVVDERTGKFKVARLGARGTEFLRRVIKPAVYATGVEVEERVNALSGRIRAIEERLDEDGGVGVVEDGDGGGNAIIVEPSFSLRTEDPPKYTGIGYKVFYKGKDGKLYPPMVANPEGRDTPIGVWLDADEGVRAGTSKTGRPQVKAGGKGTKGGSGKTLAYRPGWYLVEIPYAHQFNRMNPDTGVRDLFPVDFVWAEVEYVTDHDYQEEAMSYGRNPSGKFQHSLAGLPKIPKDGFYRYRTNPNPNTDPWIITGAMKVLRVLFKEEVDDIVRKAGREPQIVQGQDLSASFSLSDSTHNSLEQTPYQTYNELRKENANGRQDATASTAQNIASRSDGENQQISDITGVSQADGSRRGRRAGRNVGSNTGLSDLDGRASDRLPQALALIEREVKPCTLEQASSILQNVRDANKNGACVDLPSKSKGSKRFIIFQTATEEQPLPLRPTAISAH